MTGARTPRSGGREWGKEVCPTPLPSPSRAILLGESGLLSCLPFSWSSEKSPENPKCHIFFFFFFLDLEGRGLDLICYSSVSHLDSYPKEGTPKTFRSLTLSYP